MKTLKTHFSKNGLDYTLIKRNAKVALFRLGPESYPDGYEVCRVYIMRPHKAFGVDFEESEFITSNSQFIEDGSGSFRDLGNALRHFDKLTASVLRQLNFDEISSSDSMVIAECQAV
jgi:hypothetical protein